MSSQTQFKKEGGDEFSAWKKDRIRKQDKNNTISGDQVSKTSINASKTNINTSTTKDSTQFSTTEGSLKTRLERKTRPSYYDYLAKKNGSLLTRDSTDTTRDTTRVPSSTTSGTSSTINRSSKGSIHRDSCVADCQTSNNTCGNTCGKRYRNGKKTGRDSSSGYYNYSEGQKNHLIGSTKNDQDDMIYKKNKLRVERLSAKGLSLLRDSLNISADINGTDYNSVMSDENEMIGITTTLTTDIDGGGVTITRLSETSFIQTVLGGYNIGCCPGSTSNTSNGNDNHFGTDNHFTLINPANILDENYFHAAENHDEHIPFQGPFQQHVPFKGPFVEERATSNDYMMNSGRSFDELHDDIEKTHSSHGSDHMDNHMDSIGRESEGMRESAAAKLVTSSMNVRESGGGGKAMNDSAEFRIPIFEGSHCGPVVGGSSTKGTMKGKIYMKGQQQGIAQRGIPQKGYYLFPKDGFATPQATDAASFISADDQRFIGIAQNSEFGFVSAQNSEFGEDNKSEHGSFRSASWKGSPINNQYVSPAIGYASPEIMKGIKGKQSDRHESSRGSFIEQGSMSINGSINAASSMNASSMKASMAQKNGSPMNQSYGNLSMETEGIISSGIESRSLNMIRESAIKRNVERMKSGEDITSFINECEDVYRRGGNDRHYNANKSAQEKAKKEQERVARQQQTSLRQTSLRQTSLKLDKKNLSNQSVKDLSQSGLSLVDMANDKPKEAPTSITQESDRAKPRKLVRMNNLPRIAEYNSEQVKGPDGYKQLIVTFRIREFNIPMFRKNFVDRNAKYPLWNSQLYSETTKVTDIKVEDEIFDDEGEYFHLSNKQEETASGKWASLSEQCKFVHTFGKKNSTNTFNMIRKTQIHKVAMPFVSDPFCNENVIFGEEIPREEGLNGEPEEGDGSVDDSVPLSRPSDDSEYAIETDLLIHWILRIEKDPGSPFIVGFAYDAGLVDAWQRAVEKFIQYANQIGV